MKSRVFTLSAAAVLTATSLAACGSDDNLVGGSCAAGWTECGLTCVDTTSDSANCGGCGIACASGVACIASQCGGPSSSRPPSTSPTGSPDGGSPKDDALADSPTHFDGPTIEVGDDESVLAPSDATTVVPTDGAHDGAGNDGSDSSSANGSDGSSSNGGDGSNGGDVDAGASSDGASFDATLSDAGANPDAASSDSAVPETSVPDVELVDACTPPYVQNDHCGDCFTRCSGANDTCKLQPDTSYACAPFCSDPLLTHCGSQCVELQGDPDNCGACGRVCVSNICRNAKCVGATTGDIVLIGNDYQTERVDTSPARVLENALLLTPRTPVRILAYSRYASAASYTHFSEIVARAGLRSGRPMQLTKVTDDDSLVGASASNYETVVILDQATAPSGAMASLGTAAGTALNQFAHVGGVIVVLDGASGTAEMPRFVSAAGLLDVVGHTPVAFTDSLELAAGTDGLRAGVTSPFAMRAHAARFDTAPSSGSTSWVATHVDSGQPVTIHKVAP